MRRWYLTMVGPLVLLTPFVSVGQPISVDEPAVCFGCHSDVQEQKDAAHVHTAFEYGVCSDCHNPHASKHATLLKEEPVDLCLSCHDDVGEEVERSHVHSPAQAGSCTGCHNPHASPNRSQLVSTMPDLCEGCHPSVSQWLQKARIHSPVRAGNCTRCHEKHGSANERLLRRAVPTLCFDCHQRGADFARAHQGRDIGEANCIACHDPHGSDRRGLMRANQHAPFASGQCATCHTSLTSQGSFAIAGEVKELCIRCHRTAAEFANETYHHNLDDEKSCVNCHNPHASNTESMLAAEQPVLCMKCHFGGPEHKEKAKYFTHNGIDCTNCHQPHGAANRKYLIRTDVNLCLRCHQSAHTASHPVGPEVIDRRTGESVTCLSCHKLHGSGFEKYLALDPQMDLCIQCHRK